MSDALHVGTYVAEQVATTSYDLLNVTQQDFKRKNGNNQNNENPGRSPGERRLRRPKERGLIKATVLPALVSIDPLLQNAAQMAAVAEEKQKLSEQQEVHRKKRTENITISSARLARGVPSWNDDRPLTDRPGTQGDIMAVAALTQPLPWFKEASTSTSPSFGSTSRDVRGQRKKRPFRSNPWDLFKEGLRGTELDVTNSPRAQHLKVPRMPREEARRLMSLSDMPLLPEDPVEAYFQDEAARMAQKDAQKAKREEAKKAQSKETLAKPGGKARFQNMFKSSKMAEMRKEVPGTSPSSFRKKSKSKLESFADVAMFVTENYTETKKSSFWNDILDQLVPKQKLSTQRREACSMMRLFVLGAVGNESVRTKRDKENVFYENIGSKEDMIKLCEAWDKIDLDNSGKVDMMELRSFSGRLMIDVVAANAWSSTIGVSGKTLLEVSGAQRLTGWLGITAPEERAKFAQRLCERMGTVLLNSRKPHFALEDVMRLIWSCSSIDDLKQMREWCTEANLVRDKYRAATPPVLPQAEKSALQAVFAFFDKDGGGSLSVAELIMSGLMDRDYAKRFVAEVDQDGSGEIDVDEFCQLMCPNGFRAHENSDTGSTPLGESIRFDPGSGTWRLKMAPVTKTSSR